MDLDLNHLHDPNFDIYRSNLLRSIILHYKIRLNSLGCSTSDTTIALFQFYKAWSMLDSSKVSKVN